MFALLQWRRSVRSSHRSRPKFVLVFGAENWLFGHFRLFSFTAENEKCIFGRLLRQIVSDYTHDNDFQALNNPGSGQPASASKN